MPAKKKILIMSTSAGTGHVRAAEALAKAFQAAPEVAEVVNNDALQYTNRMFREFYSTLYTKLVKESPEFLGWWYEASDEPWRTDRFRLLFDRLNTGPLVDFILGYAPDVVVCTHFMPAGIISQLIAKRKITASLSIVVTDLDFHAMWLSRTFHRYFVALDETKAHLEALGLPPERITVSGIPVDTAFSQPVDAAAVRAKFRLDPAKPTILVSAGALGVGPAEAVVERLLKLKTDAQVLMVCGKNAELKEEIENVTAARAGMFRVLGFTHEMHALMQVSTLFVGKPGGLTTAEAMVCGLPMVIVSPIPGQEERNSDHLLEKGAGIKVNDLALLPYKVDLLLNDPARLAAMRANTARLGRPDAARTIVETLLRETALPPLQITRELTRRMSAEG